MHTNHSLSRRNRSPKKGGDQLSAKARLRFETSSGDIGRKTQCFEAKQSSQSRSVNRQCFADGWTHRSDQSTSSDCENLYAFTGCHSRTAVEKEATSSNASPEAHS